jgi:hypothetical protein
MKNYHLISDLFNSSGPEFGTLIRFIGFDISNSFKFDSITASRLRQGLNQYHDHYKLPTS